LEIENDSRKVLRTLAIADLQRLSVDELRKGIQLMSDHYHDENDLKLMRDMRKLAPDDFNAWLGLNNIVGRDNGAIPKKYRELIAIAVSATTQCPYCLEAHAKAAHSAGATREEVVEASLIAAALRAGAAATHGAMALKFFDKQAEQKKE
jgi:AhpD family alkylhydroperoxidase